MMNPSLSHKAARALRSEYFAVRPARVRETFRRNIVQYATIDDVPTDVRRTLDAALASGRQRTYRLVGP